MTALLLGILLTASAPVPETIAPVLSALSRVRPDVRVGEWVTYALEGGPGRQAFVRLAVVEEGRDAQDRPAYWLELEVGDHPAMQGPLAQLRMLVTRSVGFRPEGISRLYLALAHAPAYEIPSTALERVLAMGKGDAARRASERGAVTLRHGAPRKRMTFAGTLEATPVELVHHGRVVQTLWLSPLVPVLRLVSVELPVAQQRMEVREYGLDARSRMRLPDADSRRLRLEPERTP